MPQKFTVVFDALRFDTTHSFLETNALITIYHIPVKCPWFAWSPDVVPPSPYPLPARVAPSPTIQHSVVQPGLSEASAHFEYIAEGV